MQKVFDTDNADDMALLWSILPDDIEKIEVEEANGYNRFCYKKVGACEHSISSLKLIAINWHDKVEITRPIQEATEADIGKLCVFWDEKNPEKYDKHYGIFTNKVGKFYELELGPKYNHCRRLTKEEISELC